MITESPSGNITLLPLDILRLSSLGKLRGNVVVGPKGAMIMTRDGTISQREKLFLRDSTNVAVIISSTIYAVILDAVKMNEDLLFVISK